MKLHIIPFDEDGFIHPRVFDESEAPSEGAQEHIERAFIDGEFPAVGFFDDFARADEESGAKGIGGHGFEARPVVDGALEEAFGEFEFGLGDVGRQWHGRIDGQAAEDFVEDKLIFGRFNLLRN